MHRLAISHVSGVHAFNFSPIMYKTLVYVRQPSVKTLFPSLEALHRSSHTCRGVLQSVSVVCLSVCMFACLSVCLCVCAIVFPDTK